MRRLVLAVALLGWLVMWGSSAKAAARPYDFNGDGFGDLAVAVPGEGAMLYDDGGSVQVIYGSRRGLTGRGNQIFPVVAPGTPPVVDSAFASVPRLVVASGDFDGDGCADLVVSAPDREVDGVRGAGSLAVAYGSARGLGAAPRQGFAGGHGLPGAPEASAGLGTALATGDFNRDGYADLAVGAPGVTVSGHRAAGAVVVMPGSAAGLAPAGSRWWTQDTPGIADAADLFVVYDGVEFSERFGSALASGDANGDGFADLAIGVPGETFTRPHRDPEDAAYDAGAVHLLLGRGTGLSARGNQFWSQATPGVPDAPGSQTDVDGDPTLGDEFGGVLAFGDFNTDGRDDLAVGVPHEVIGDCPDEFPCDDGAINILNGARHGLTARGSLFLHAYLRGVPGSTLVNAAAWDVPVGRSLAAGDLNGDGVADLAVAAAATTVPPARYNGGEGAVLVFRGGDRGLAAARNRMLTQDTPGVAGEAEPGDAFGSSIAARNFGRGTEADLAIGARFEDVDAARDAGAVTVVYGSTRGIAARGSREWHQNVPGIRGRAETMDWFGDL